MIVNRSGAADWKSSRSRTRWIGSITEAELKTLHTAFSQQLDRADAELKRIKAQALDESRTLNVINVSQFENLIEEVYRLSESS